MATVHTDVKHPQATRLLRSLKGLVLSPEAILPLIVVAIGLYLAIETSAFFTPLNLQNLARQSSVLLIVAVGEAIVVLGRGIDLSVGSVMAVTSVVGAMAAKGSGIALLGLAVTLLLGAGIGLANGIAIGIFRLSPLIVTLASLSIFRGLALWISDGASVTGMPAGFATLGNESVGRVPYGAIASLIVLVFGIILLHGTRWGTYVYAIGNNPRAAALSGIRVPAITVALYLLSGLLAGFASAILTSQLNSGSPLLAQGMEFDVLAAVFLGGVVFLAGRGSLWGVFLAVIVLTEIQNGLNLVGVQPFWQTVVPGAVLLAAVSLQRVVRRPADT